MLYQPQNIAVISTRFGSNFMTTVIEGMEDMAFKMPGKSDRIDLYSNNADSGILNSKLSDILRSRLAKAVIVLYNIPGREQAEQLNRANIPVILIENIMPGISSIRIENEKASYTAGAHFVKTGKKNTGMISGITVGEKDNENMVMQERERGFKKSLKDGGIVFDEEMLETTGMYQFSDGEEIFEKLIKKNKNMDAVFCAAGDLVAMGCMKKAKSMGYRIPQDIAIIGYDDIQAAQLTSPALTTVRQPIKQMGEEAFKMAIELSEGSKKGPIDLILPAELVIRESA